MGSAHRKTVSALLSALFPGAGHLYQERYALGTIGVIFTTWTLIALLVSTIILTPGAGIGRWVFPLALYTLIALWGAMLASVLLTGVRFRRRRLNRDQAYAEGYAGYLTGRLDEARDLFRRLYDDNETLNIAAGVMLARVYARQEQPVKAGRLLKRMRRRPVTPSWSWEIESFLEELSRLKQD